MQTNLHMELKESWYEKHIKHTDKQLYNTPDTHLFAWTQKNLHMELKES